MIVTIRDKRTFLRGFLYTSARGSLKAEKELEMFSRRDDITPLKIITREPPQKGKDIYFYSCC